jgi:hypothetical protein
MPEDRHIPDSFDTWLADGLKRGPRVSPAFAGEVMQKVERIKAEKLLRKVALQERAARWGVIVTIAAGIGMLCYPPVLRLLYGEAASGWTSIIHAIAHPASLNMTMSVLALLAIGLLAAAAIERLSAD